MKRGRPAKSQTRPARQARARSTKADAAASALAADPDASPPPPARKSRRAPVRKGLVALLAGQWLDDAGNDVLRQVDRQAIRAALEEDLDVRHLGVLVQFELALARRLYERGHIDGKALMVALAKATSHAAAVAQLAAARTAQSLPPRLEVVFATDTLPSAVGMAGREQIVRAPLGPTGDRLDVEA